MADITDKPAPTPCPRTGCNGTLRPRLTRDGGAMEGEECSACEATWMFEYPRPLPAAPPPAPVPGWTGDDQRVLAEVERALDHLPDLLDKWPTLDSELRDHYRDETVYLSAQVASLRVRLSPPPSPGGEDVGAHALDLLGCLRVDVMPAAFVIDGIRAAVSRLTADNARLTHRLRMEEVTAQQNLAMSHAEHAVVERLTAEAKLRDDAVAHMRKMVGCGEREGLSEGIGRLAADNAALRASLDAAEAARDEWKHEAEAQRAKTESNLRLLGEVKRAREAEEKAKRRLERSMRGLLKKRSQWRELKGQRDAALADVARLTRGLATEKAAWQRVYDLDVARLKTERDEARGKALDIKPGSSEHVELWDAINEYTTACHGDPSKHVYGNTKRMGAVARVEAAIRALAAKGGG